MTARRLRWIALAGLVSVAAGACTDSPTAPGTSAEIARPFGAVGEYADDFNLTLMQSAASTFGRPYWARNCTGRICVSLRGLIVANEVTETRVAVGPNLFGPAYPDWTLENLEYFILNHSKGGQPWKLAIVTNLNVPQNGQRKYHERNFTGIHDGDQLCVRTQVKGAITANGRSTTATELYTTCTTVRYAADVRTTIALNESTFEWSENPVLIVTATFDELRGIMPATFNPVLLINGQPVESRPTTQVDAGGTITGVTFYYDDLTPGNHNVSVAAINVLPGDYNPVNNVDTEPFVVTVFGTPPVGEPGGGGGGGDTRTSRELCAQENVCPPRSLEYRAFQEFDTTFSMGYSRSIRNGEVVATSFEVNQLTFAHTYSTFMDAVWDIDITYPVDSISLQQVTRASPSDPWQVIDLQDNTTSPALKNLVPNDGPDCHEGENNHFGFTLCRIFLDGRWQAKLTYNHSRTATSSYPDLATATLFFGPDLTNPTPHHVDGTDYQGVGNTRLLGSQIRYAMNVYLPGGKLLQAWATMEIKTQDLSMRAQTIPLEDDCSFDSLNCDQVIRYSYNGSIRKTGGEGVDNARH